MKTICVIGARSGSKSIKHKNLQKVCGRSILRISIDKALLSKLFDKIYISSDSYEYISEVPQNDLVKFVLRPKEISTDESFEGDYLRHVSDSFGLSSRDIICRMQCTSPFQSLNSIKSSINLLLNDNEADGVQIITKSSTSTFKSLSFIDDTNQIRPTHAGCSLGPSNRQKYTTTYFRSNFYAIRSASLRNKQYLGPKCLGYVGEDREAIDIDDEFDLQVARALAACNPTWLDS